ncbi:MAG: PorV/PorQ family protein [candidate division Zixibacteria bacterium]|nr:PorV/PorQ family protein [candidate division Zixibacteria bacterium]MBU1471626.1 PorV/PorQ family protein [candidate division Zixibacteria bacterium]MBU2625240.1 PorV/PorQ family protein [candidate division Zixibacteria bacterium]
MRERFRIAVMILAIALVLAGLVQAEPQGGRESLFVLGAGTRALGMGGAFSAIPGDVSSVYWNPACLSLLEYRQLIWTHVTLYEETSYDFAAAAWPILDFGTIGVGGMKIGTGGIEFRDEYGPLGTYDYSNGQYWLSYARSIYRWIHGGANIKLVDQSLAGFSSSTASIDAGLLLQPFSMVSFGVNVQDVIAGKMKLLRAEEGIPYNIKFGAAVNWMNAERSFGVIAAMDFDKTEGQPASRHFGAELMFMKYMLVRGGYDREDITFGAGIRYRLLGADYAYKSNDVLGASHRFGLTLFFGPTVSEQRQHRIERGLLRESQRRDEENRSRIDGLWQSAFDAFSRNDLDSASLLCSQLIGYEPEHEEAIRLMQRIRELKNEQTESQIEEKSRERAVGSMVTDRVANGMSLLNEGKLGEAREELNQALKLDSTNVAALDGLARIDAAVARRVQVHISNGDARFSVQDYGEAVVSWNRALELKPDLPIVREKVARAKRLMVIDQRLRDALETYAEGDTAQARSLFTEVLTLDQNNATAIEYIRIMDRVEAETITLDELRQDTEYWKLYLDGLGYFRNKQYDEAIDAWEKVLEKYPGNREALTNIGQAKLRRDK